MGPFGQFLGNSCDQFEHVLVQGAADAFELNHVYLRTILRAGVLRAAFEIPYPLLIMPTRAAFVKPQVPYLLHRDALELEGQLHVLHRSFRLSAHYVDPVAEGRAHKMLHVLAAVLRSLPFQSLSQLRYLIPCHPQPRVELFSFEGGLQ